MLDKKKIENDKGITLIVLAVTVLIMLILSGVAIRVAVGDEGLIKRAETATNRYEEGQEGEIARLEEVEGKYNNMLKKVSGREIKEIRLPSPIPTLEPTITPNPTQNPPTPTPTPSPTPTPIEPDPEVLLLADAKGGEKVDATAILIDENGELGILPGGFRVSEDSVTDVKKGVIIVDEAGNEFVWVPVTDSTTMYEEEVTKLAGVEVTTNRYSKLRVRSGNASSYIPSKPSIETAYHVKEPDLLTNTNYGDFNSDDINRGVTQIKNVLGIEGGYDEEILKNFAISMVEEYNTIMDSIVKYNGFYIGRYELTGTTTAPTCQRGSTVLTNVNWYALKRACQDIVNNQYVKSTMIYGNQWDEVMNWLIMSGAKTDEEVNTSSKEWGNYSGTKRTSAYDEAWQVNNIYDLAGNCGEWTQEAYINNQRVWRGAYYSNTRPASNRISQYAYYSSSTYISSRPVLIVK